MVALRWLVLVALVLVLNLTSAAEPQPRDKQPTPPTKAQIRGWILQLGDDDFEKREEASKKLWEAGEAAEAAVKEATKSDDAEVARRARELWEKFQLGIYPSTPAAMVDLIGRYQQAEPAAKFQLVEEFMKNGPAGCRLLFKVVESEGNQLIKDTILARMNSHLPGVVPLFVEEKDQPLLEKVIDAGLKVGKGPGIRNAAAYWMSRGQLEERIRHYQALLANKTAPALETAEVLAYLLRAAGKPAAALETVRGGDHEELVEALLAETGNWKELATRTTKFGNTTVTSQVAHEAAYNRMAGNRSAYEKAVANLVESAKTAPNGGGINRLAIARPLLVLGKPKEALEVLALDENYLETAVELLAAQNKFREALRLLHRSPDDPFQDERKGELLLNLQILEARLLFILGEIDKAKKLVNGIASRMGEPRYAEKFALLVHSELRAGLVEEAFTHAGIILAGGENVVMLSRFWTILFPSQASQAESLWIVLHKLFPQETAQKRLARLREALAGKVAAKELMEWVEKLEALTKTLKAEEVREADKLWFALAEAAILNNQDALGRSCLLKSGTSTAILRLGDLLAAATECDQASQRYFQAWELDRTQAVALYLSGKALVNAGKAKEGKVRLEQAQALPLGNEVLRFRFCDELARRGETAALRQAIDLQLKLCDPNGFYYGDALRRLSLLPESKKDPTRQADLEERSLLRLYRERITLQVPAGYLVLPSHVHRQRALGLLAAGKNTAALEELTLCQEYLPGNTALVIALTPALEKAGEKREAEALFERAVKVHEGVLKDYPRFAMAHNSIAWMSACCHRNLDSALKHAEQAVELAPKTVGYLDTLAEVLFQQGNQKKAVELEKRVIALEPGRQYYHKQLKRMEAGDRQAPLPPETDDD